MTLTKNDSHTYFILVPGLKLKLILGLSYDYLLCLIPRRKGELMLILEPGMKFKLIPGLSADYIPLLILTLILHIHCHCNWYIGAIPRLAY